MNALPRTLTLALLVLILPFGINMALAEPVKKNPEPARKEQPEPKRPAKSRNLPTLILGTLRHVMGIARPAAKLKVTPQSFWPGLSATSIGPFCPTKKDSAHPVSSHEDQVTENAG